MSWLVFEGEDGSLLLVLCLAKGYLLLYQLSQPVRLGLWQVSLLLAVAVEPVVRRLP